MSIYRGSITPGAGSTIAVLASDITSVPYGTLLADTVQDALNELQDDKVEKSGDTMTGTLSIDGISSNLLIDGGHVDIGDAGFEADGIDINGVIYTPKLRVNDIGTSNPAQMVMHRHSTTLQPLILGARSNDETSTHTAVTNGQGVFSILGAGYTGSHYDVFGSIDIAADTGTISSTSSPGKIVFNVTPDGSNTLAPAMTISQDKEIILVNDLAVTEGGTGSSTASGALTNLGVSAYGQTLIDDADAGTARTTLGLGTIATQASSNVTITGGSITGITDLTVADGGTGVSTFTDAGVLIGNGTGVIQATSAGTTGQVLTSNGTSVDPTFQTPFIIATGDIIIRPVSTVPTGYLECDGSSLDTTTYATLYAVLGYTYGGSGSNFNIPDYRGEFLRGWAHGSTNDPDRASRTDRGDGTTGDNIGTKQGYEVESHLHTYDLYNTLGYGTAALYGGNTFNSTKNTTSTGGNETRPRNVNVMYCIKY